MFSSLLLDVLYVDAGAFGQEMFDAHDVTIDCRLHQGRVSIPGLMVYVRALLNKQFHTLKLAVERRCN